MKFKVTVRATITKTLEVDARDEDEAAAVARDLFSVLEDGTDEDYQEDVLEIEGEPQ